VERCHVAAVSAGHPLCAQSSCVPSIIHRACIRCQLLLPRLLLLRRLLLLLLLLWCSFTRSSPSCCCWWCSCCCCCCGAWSGLLLLWGA
jgi:hypothetical protein